MIDPPRSQQTRILLGRHLAQLRATARLTQEQLAALICCSRGTVANAETGFGAGTGDFWARCDGALNADGALIAHYQQVIAERGDRQRAITTTLQLSAVLTVPLTGAGAPVLVGDEEPSGVDRRTILAGAGASVFAGVLAAGARTDPAAALIAAILDRRPPADPARVDLEDLATRVATAQRRYQSCAYAELLTALPALLSSLTGTAQQVHRDHVATLHRLTAEAFHVAGSVLLKSAAASIAMLAADRSLTAAHRSGDPITVAASARLMTHALIGSGHPAHAAEYAADTAARLDPAVPVTPAANAVLGALLLRGAVGAARAGDRHGTASLLSQADERAHRTEPHGNLRRTGFNATNVQLHRVHTALTLGDAGQAIDHARHVDLATVPLPERRARLMVDVAHAYAQWNKPEAAFQALRAAEETAPEEVRARATVRRLIDTLHRTAPATLRPHVLAMAQRTTQP